MIALKKRFEGGKVYNGMLDLFALAGSALDLGERAQMPVAIQPHDGNDLLEVLAISYRFLRLPCKLAGESQAAQTIANSLFVAS